MTAVDAPAPTLSLSENIVEKLMQASSPLKMAQLVKALPGKKTVEFLEELQRVLESEIQNRKVFSYPSGQEGEIRYWAKDERLFLIKHIMEHAEKPTKSVQLVKIASKAVPGVQATFVETVLNDLVSERRLFEHPAKMTGGQSTFSTSPPPSALESRQNRKVVDRIVGECRKLLGQPRVDLELLMTELRNQLLKPAPVSELKPTTEEPLNEMERLDDLILKAVGNTPMVNLAELRREVPIEFRGDDFNQTVLQMSRDGKIRLSTDGDVSQYSEPERAEFVREGDRLYTTISKA